MLNTSMELMIIIKREKKVTQWCIYYVTLNLFMHMTEILYLPT